ncbi:hypothetical protein SAMN05446037_100287 [Anaerovirgula multivorans]|uniref:Uncharacterized protein n=1 Tax=Anaerovirgula multivorans TaxID=312168 RepID=A0A239AJD9_9FIRM|nr:hypothetical protein [Anaerovirgula multivorans]SNR95787.1 hypothetical protein SAMN05446037_100287 [Anaerovirgula multivorans]
MKQNINTEQLNTYLELKVENGVANLNFEKQRKLNKALGIESKRNYPPTHLIDIGKMIEILEKECILVACTFSNTEWVVYIKLYKEDEIIELDFKKHVLCDALWKAIKQVL